MPSCCRSCWSPSRCRPAAACEAQDWGHLALNMLVLSPGIGAVVALAAVGMLEFVRRRTGVRRDYESIYSLGVAFAAFAGAEAVHGSGFLAAFAAGLTISALDVELCDCFLEYGETTAEMALLFTFVLFGASVVWSGLTVLSPMTLAFTALVFLAVLPRSFPALLPARDSVAQPPSDCLVRTSRTEFASCSCCWRYLRAFRAESNWSRSARWWSCSRSWCTASRRCC